MPDTLQDSGRSYHRECTGEAAATASAHSEREAITLFGSCFCPFVQRVWITLEHLGIDYTYYEVDPYKKPAELLELSPKGLVPALKLHNHDPPKALNESTVIIDFLEELAASDVRRSSHTTGSLFPPASDPYARALIRLQADAVNRNVVPAFYRYLQAQEEGVCSGRGRKGPPPSPMLSPILWDAYARGCGDSALPDKQVNGAKGFVDAIGGVVALFKRAQQEGYTTYGLWNVQGSLSYADVMIAPWILRATNVLKYYRGFVWPENEGLQAYVQRLLANPAVKRTCNTEELYLDSYERYAFNRPNTSQVANAINAGRALP